jgi:hypothetical protein
MKVKFIEKWGWGLDDKGETIDLRNQLTIELNDLISKLSETKTVHYFEWGQNGCVCADCDKQINHT